MIVNVRLEVTDEQRSVLSLRLFPKAAKRLATRGEFNELMQDHLLHLTQPQAQSRVIPYVPFDDAPLVPVQEDAETSSEAVPINEESNPGGESTKYIKLLRSITNGMHAMANATMLAKKHCPKLAPRFEDLRATVVDLRYEIADKHDAEMESKL